MSRLFVTSMLDVGLGFAAVPASAVVYCKTVGVPKGCVARPAAGTAQGVSVTNQNGGVNRVGVRR